MGARKYVGQASMKQRLEDLIEEMITGGIRFPEAQREFEKRFLSRAARTLHIHRNTLSKKLQELKLGPHPK